MIGYEKSEQLDVKPAEYFVVVTKREKRACKGCEEQAPDLGSPRSSQWSKPVGGSKIPVRDYLGSVLPGLADFPISRIAELTPTAWAARNQLPNPARGQPCSGKTGTVKG